MVALPIFVGTSRFGAAFKPVALLGWFFVIVGTGLFWWARQSSSTRQSIAPEAKFRRGPSAQATFERKDPWLPADDAPVIPDRSGRQDS